MAGLARKPKALEGRGWITTATAQAVLGVPHQHWAKYRKLLQDDAVHAEGNGKPTWIRFPVLLNAILERDRAKVARALGAPTRNTPALERYRVARACLAESDLERGRTELVDIEVVQDQWRQVSDKLRQALSRTCSACAGDWDVVLDSCERLMTCGD